MIITRAEAKARGLKRYFTGKPCGSRGHVAERYISGACVTCVCAHKRNENSTPEEIERKNARARLANMTPEQIERKRQRGRRPNMAPEQIEKTNARKRKENMTPAQIAKRNAHVRAQRSGITPEIFNSLWREQGGRCALCSIELSHSKAQADHCHDTKTPRGLLCLPCNSFEGRLKKIKMNPEEWGRRLTSYRQQPPWKRLDNYLALGTKDRREQEEYFDKSDEAYTEENIHG
jgi:hypothetical protein